MWKIILYAFSQSILLVGAQIFLKVALERMLPFAWNKAFWCSVFLNWQFAVCGVLFASASFLWMYIIKHFPFSTVYPMISLSYVFGLVASILVFHEDVAVTKWAGVALIVIGCFLIAK